MAASARAVLLGAGLTIAAAGCGAAGTGGGPSTLPTLPPSSLATTAPPATTVATVPTTPPPLTAPRGGPSTDPPASTAPLATVATTARPSGTSTSFPSGGPAQYADEPPTGPLQIGLRGPRVQTLQGQLITVGYGINADGYFGRGTQAAVMDFQKRQGVPADGIASEDTQARLAQAAAGR